MSDYVPTDLPNLQLLEQEVKDQAQFLQIELIKNKRATLLLSLIEDCQLDDHLKERVKDVILAHETSDNLLGVSMDEEELTCSESTQLCYSLRQKLEALPKQDTISKGPLDLPCGDARELELHSQLTRELELYVKNQKQAEDLLEELTQIRLTVIPDLLEQKYEQVKLSSELNHIKANVTREKCRVDIFTETPNSLHAYKELLKDLKEEENELKEDIIKLKELKEKYADVSCAEYNDILKSYLQYKSSLDKKKLMYKICN